jgi:putative glutathione S-transferase
MALVLMTSCAADGVYKCGFAQSQAAYENAVHPLFKSLDRLEEILKGKDYLVGNTLTEADIRLFVTTVRSILNALILL